MLSKEVWSTIFKVLIWLDLGLNPGLPDHWGTLYPLDQLIQKCCLTLLQRRLLGNCDKILILKWTINQKYSNRKQITAGWVIYIYIYIYIYTQISLNIRHFLSTYFLVDLFILPYYFYRIRWELIDVFSMIVYIPSTFYPTLGHHQGRIYFKRDVTFVFALLLCKSVFTIGVCSICF